MKTVLVTRPEPLASLLAERLRAIGYRTRTEPLLKLSPRLSLPPDGSENAAILLTSRLVFSALAARRKEVEGFLDNPCYCVGDRTCEQARLFGFSRARSAEGDGAELAQLVLAQEKGDRPVLHIGGEDVHPEGWASLAAAGRRVLRWVVYKAEETAGFSPSFLDALSRDPPCAALFFSSRTAQIFAARMRAAKSESLCAMTTAVGVSQAVLAHLDVLSFRRAVAAAAPTETGVIDCLRRYAPAT